MNGNVIIPSEISKTKKNKEKLPKNLFGSGSIGEADENTDESEETDDTEEETTNETEEEMSNENIKEKQSNGEIVDPINNVKPQEFEGVSSVQIPKQKIKRLQFAISLIGTTGLEPASLSSLTRCSTTKLSYAPIHE